MRPWFGLHLPSYTFPETPPEGIFDRLLEQVRTAEDAGFDLITVMDHLYQIQGVGPVTDPMLEGWSTLAALARETTRPRLGTLVTGVTYRNPALLAKTATTLDVISGGRAILGLGAAWNDVEHAGYGFEFPADPRADGPPRRGPDDHPRDVHARSGRASRAATTGSRTPSTSRGRSSRAAHASWSAAAASSGR